MQHRVICLQKKITGFKWTVSKTTDLYYILNMSMPNSLNLLEYKLFQIFALC